MNFNSLENFICLLWRCKNIIMMFCDKRNSRNCLSWTLDGHKTLHKHKTVWKMQHKTSVSSSYWKSWHRINFTEHFMRRKMDLFTDYCQQRLVGRLLGGFVKAAELLLCCALDLERDHTFFINSFWPKCWHKPKDIPPFILKGLIHCTVGDDVQPGQMAISGQKPSWAHLLVAYAPPYTAK